MIIGISGHAQSGKDKTGSYLLEFAAKEGYLFRIRKFAAYVKQIASILTGIAVTDFEKSEVKNSYLGDEWTNASIAFLFGDIPEAKMTVRQILQKIGTDCMRDNLHVDTWVNALMKDYREPYTFWIITDVRFHNEFKAIRDRGGILIRMERDLDEDVEALHISETALDRVTDWDYVIDNNGTLEDLKLKVEEIWKKIKTNIQKESMSENTSRLKS